MVYSIWYIVYSIYIKSSVKDKILSLFKTNTTENYSKPIYVSNMYGGQKKPTK